MSNGEVRWPRGEHESAVETRRVVFMRDVDASAPQPRGVHDPVVTQHVVLAGQHVGAGQTSQGGVGHQERRSPWITQASQKAIGCRRHRGCCRRCRRDHWRCGVVVATTEVFGQKGTPVGELEQGGRLGPVVDVGQHGVEQGLVAGEVLAPEAHHERAGQDGHVLILPVGRCVEVKRLHRRVQQNLGLQFHLLLWILLQLRVEIRIRTTVLELSLSIHTNRLQA